MPGTGGRGIPQAQASRAGLNKYPREEEEEEEWPLNVPARTGGTWGFGEGGEHTKGQALGAA